MKKMSKSITDYLENSGWSSENFLDHAKYAFEKLAGTSVDVKVGRTVIYLTSQKATIKLYVHRNGLSNKFLTITDENGDDLEVLHCDIVSPEDLYAIICKHLDIP